MENKQLTSILYVDDDPTMRELIGFLFTELGKLKVEICGSGSEALQKAEHCLPDLLLLDVEMPEMDGLATLHKLRNLSNTANTPAIFFSSNGQEKDIELYRKVGAIGFIPKPVESLHNLHHKVISFWDNWQKEHHAIL